MDKWGDDLVAAVDKIVSLYEGYRGIIHTHNFYIAELLLEKCAPEVRKRMLFQKNFSTKTTMLDVHKLRPDSVIVAPAMHEGLDLADDLSRFQIICKVPFPNFYEDKQLAARIEHDSRFLDWLTALKLVQSAGRSVRSVNDWAHTYIIDKTFWWWYRRTQHMLPQWFREAVRYINELPTKINRVQAGAAHADE